MIHNKLAKKGSTCNIIGIFYNKNKNSDLIAALFEEIRMTSYN